MQKAAAELDFEKAAELRDEIRSLKDLLLKHASQLGPEEEQTADKMAKVSFSYIIHLISSTAIFGNAHSFL